jgi:lipopolysaccharide transport system ATP-binding protein
MLVRGRKQYFREFWALRDISIQVKRGESVGIIGRNGSGKSTLLQLICGTLTPTSGSVQTHGRIAALLELGSGFNPEFTGRENVYLNATLLGLKQEEIDAEYEKIVAFADIGDFIDQPVKSYSSGMYVRLAFAVIAHVRADILVIDEALAVGDAFFTQKCMRFLREFMEKGTIFFVSHDTASIKALCSHAVWLERGRIQQQGEPKEICERYLEAFYEAQQGRCTAKTKSCSKKKPTKPVRDQREKYINYSNLRNDIKVFEFVPDASGFGKGDARIVDVALQDSEGYPLCWIVGGEEVVLRVEVLTLSALNSPIVGFYVKDRLGQRLFGDNTYITYFEDPVRCGAKQTLVAEFVFQMPRLALGDYSITVSIADGTQDDHVQHHWIHDAMIFRSESTSVVGGCVGIPMNDIHLTIK